MAVESATKPIPPSSTGTVAMNGGGTRPPTTFR